MAGSSLVPEIEALRDAVKERAGGDSATTRISELSPEEMRAFEELYRELYLRVGRNFGRFSVRHASN